MNAKFSVFLVCVETIMYSFLYNLHDCTFKHVLFFPKIYRKIPLTRPGRIYGQNSNLKFDGPIFRWGRGRLILGRKKTSIYNLLNLFFFLFSSIKHVFRHFSRRATCEICSKLTIKTAEYVMLTIKLKIKTPLTSFWPLYC